MLSISSLTLLGSLALVRIKGLRIFSNGSSKITGPAVWLWLVLTGRGAPSRKTCKKWWEKEIGRKAWNWRFDMREDYYRWKKQTRWSFLGGWGAAPWNSPLSWAHRSPSLCLCLRLPPGGWVHFLLAASWFMRATKPADRPLRRLSRLSYFSDFFVEFFFIKLI